MKDTNNLNSNINKIIILNLYIGDFNMSIEEEQIVMPGDKLGIIEQYLPGEGTYDDNGEIKSSVLGNVKINQKMKVISVESDAKPALLKVGDVVYGQITDIKPQRANVKIDCIKDNARPLALPYMGAIHISQAKKDYLEKLSDAFRIGDIVQAKVVKITGDNVEKLCVHAAEITCTLQKNKTNSNAILVTKKKKEKFLKTTLIN